MNRSILIVICDFLLVSLLTFSTLDISKVGDESNPPTVPTATTPKPATARQDLGDAMRQALAEERKDHAQLLSELAQTRASLGQKQALLAEQESVIKNREKQLQETETLIRTREQQIKNQEKQIQDREQQVRIFQQQVAASEDRAQRMKQEQASLQGQYQTAISNLQALNNELKNNAVQNMLTKEGLAATEAEAKDQAARAAALQEQLAQLAQSNQVAQVEKQRLNTQLQLAESEKKAASENAVHLQEQVKAERAEKAKLADSVKTLAANTGALAQKIDANHPLAPNAVFSAVATNRVDLHFDAMRAGLFGIESNKRQDTKIVLVSNGTNTFALCHIRDTPLTLSVPGAEWQSLTAMLSRNYASCAMPAISFLQTDPRVVLIPVTKAQAQALGGQVYQLAPNPLAFQEAVVVGTRDNYYGECKFQIDLSIPNYLIMDRNSLKGLFGKFNPSTGDLVFSKNGDLLGVMANNTFCVILPRLDTITTIQLGDDIRAQHTGPVLETLANMISDLPSPLR